MCRQRYHGLLRLPSLILSLSCDPMPSIVSLASSRTHSSIARERFQLPVHSPTDDFVGSGLLTGETFPPSPETPSESPRSRAISAPQQSTCSRYPGYTGGAKGYWEGLKTGSTTSVCRSARPARGMALLIGDRRARVLPAGGHTECRSRSRRAAVLLEGGQKPYLRRVGVH